MIIDTHLHLIDRAALRYPWLAGVPALDRDFSYAEYATDAHRCGIEAALHMEVDVNPADIEAETACVEVLAGQAGSLLKGAIASCRPEEAEFRRLSRTGEGRSIREGLSACAARGGG